MDKGADPNAVWDNEEEATPLHLAAWLNRTESARLLLEHGAKADALDAEAHTPLFLAVSFGNIDMIKLLAPKANLEARNESDLRLTALHLAASQGKLDIIRILAGAGADPTATAGHPVGSPEIFGLTARKIAEQKGHRQAAALLAELEQSWTAGKKAAVPPVTRPPPASPPPTRKPKQQ